MIKLLIVDDEPLVQIGIKSMLNWAEYGIEICGTAMNGEAALSMIEEFAPELVITDIKMPIMNGLDLVKICREQYGAIPVFIVLTSYEEFQLVRTALSYQVADYLIKLELDPASLAESVNRALERLKEQQASQAYQNSGGRPLLQGYQDKFFLRLLHNLFDSEEQFQLQVADLKLDFQDACYVAAHCEFHESAQKDMNLSQLVNLYSSSLQMVREILSRYLSCYVVSLDLKYFSIIFHFSTIEELDWDFISTALDNARNMIHNYFSVWLSAGLGGPAEQPMQISRSYQEARQAASLADKEHPISFFRDIGEDSDSFRNYFNMAIFRQAITQAFEEFDTDVLSHTIDELCELFSSHSCRLLQAVDGACNIMYLAISLLPDGEETIAGIFDDIPGGYRSIYQASSTQQVVDWLKVLGGGLCHVLSSKKKTYKEHVITSIQKYIDNHLEDRLLLNEVAGVFGLSPNYLSSLFKKTCNIGFTEYVTQKKISRAKVLLLEEDMKIYEAADRLGFESAFYFSKVFKKVEGISPREFIQQHTG